MSPCNDNSTHVSRWTRWVGLCCLLAAMLAACGGGSDERAEAREVPCETAIEWTDELGDFYSEGPPGVAFPRGHSLEQLGRSGDIGTATEGLRYSKFGLPVRADTRILLEVAGSDDTTTLLTWGSAIDRRLAVGPCPSSAEWVVFAGGVWVEDATCVAIGASNDDRTEIIELGVGTGC